MTPAAPPSPIDLAPLRKAAEAATQYLASGHWRADDYGKVQIWGDGLKDGDTLVADVRGWGYLTGGGHGALSLDSVTAIQAQYDIACHIAAANPATVLALIDEVERLREAVAPLVQFIAAYDRDGQNWTDDSSVAEVMDGPIRRDIRLGTLRRLAALSAQPTNAGEG